MIELDMNDERQRTYHNVRRLLVKNGVLPAMALPLAQTIVDAVLHDPRPRLERRFLRTAHFASEFDDGSVFESLCVIDKVNRTVVDIAPAGTASDDAACVNQTVTYRDVEYHVYDDDMDDRIEDDYFLMESE